MEITTYVQENNVVLLEIVGEVDAYTAQDLDRALTNLLGQGHHRIVVDITKMTFISSAGIREILYAHREAVQSGGEVRLVGPTDQVSGILEIAGFYEILLITDDLQDAVNDW